MRIFLSLLTLVAAMSTQALENADFKIWLDELRNDALAQGIKASTLDKALADVQLIPRVIELDRKQPEFTLSFEQYRQRVIPQSRINKGRLKLKANKELLDGISKKYGVQARFIVALWGIETDFGRVSGGFPVINSLVTLAHDGRRSAYFRKELMQALKILDGEHTSVEKMMGSWAGAMGQTQFMPSSFNNFAVDYDGDGKKDIWGSSADALASGANYLAKSGWNDSLTWGREVTLPENIDKELLGRKKPARSLKEWSRLGVMKADGNALPNRDIPANIVLPGKNNSPAYVVYSNYHTILKWNRSDYFATAVGLLSDAIAQRQ